MSPFREILAFCVVFSTPTLAVLVSDLGGKWALRDGNMTCSLNATVPGGIYSDLMDEGIIEDVFYGFNDINTRWVSMRSWIYSRNFDVNQTLYESEAINVVFDGLDTFSSIFINGQLVGTTDNMFVRYMFDVKRALQVGQNTIAVEFLSPVQKADELYKKQLLKYKVPPACVPSQYHGECHVNHIRKMQASFSWDWGPAFPSVGIWKPVYLEAYNSTVIRYATFENEENPQNDSWDVDVRVYFSKPAVSDYITGQFAIKLKTDLNVITVYTDELKVYADGNGEYVLKEKFSVPKLDVSLWWPNGYGNAVLYPLTLTYRSDNDEISEKRLKIGFRTVKLIQNQISNGSTFYFEVNNVPIFAKGTNSIPVSILPEKGQDRDQIAFLLGSAKEAHMNLIRVWGGGIYESEAFYEIADEKGLMIWQDFMFACSMYPTDEDFLSTVKNEVRHQVRLLQHHPSIVLWAGNNENEAALRQNWYGTSSNFDKYKEDYVQLYVNTVKVETLLNDRSRPFLVSSPTNGAESEQEGYVAGNPQSNFYGDVHYYNYISNPWDQNMYPINRFASEYGLQSFPSLSTMLTATNNVSDLNGGSAFLKHRQHHPNGNTELEFLISFQADLPPSESDNFYQAFSYYSQVIQAVGMKQETEYYRLWRSNLNSAGQGLTMGALYWQLNDVWAAPSWSGIDFKNNWKMLHYHAKKFFAPVIVTGHLQSDGNLNVYVVSDLLTNSYNNTLIISVYKWNSTEVFHEERIQAHALSGFSQQVTSFWLEQYLIDLKCGDLIDAVDNCFIYLQLNDGAGNPVAPENFVFPTTLQNVDIPDAVVKINSVNQLDKSGKLFRIEIETDAIALFVWLESNGTPGIFSDNGFLLVNRLKIVQFRSFSPTTVTDLEEALAVTHFGDPQYS